MMYLLNAFSLNMLAGDANLCVRQVSLDVARILSSGATSAVGHADTANVFGDVLGAPCGLQSGLCDPGQV